MGLLWDRFLQLLFRMNPVMESDSEDGAQEFVEVSAPNVKRRTTTYKTGGSVQRKVKGLSLDVRLLKPR